MAFGRAFPAVLAGLGVFVCAHSSAFGADLTAAEDRFVKSCGTCHTTDAAAPPRQGPHLEGVIGRKSASVEGFKYSDALRALNTVWDAETLDRWITNAAKMAPGTTMNYRQRNPERRELVIMYLMHLSQQTEN